MTQLEPAGIDRARGTRRAGFVVELRRLLARDRVTPLVLVISSVWSSVFVAVAVSRHETIRSHRFDLGNMVQAVWSTAHGRPLEITIASGEQMSRLGIHVDPILALFAPLWWLFPTPLLLVVVQGIALALGALPVAWLARRHLESSVAAVFLAAAYLLYLPIAWNAVNDFHPITLAIPLLLFAIWFLDGDRLLPFAACAALALLSNELIGLGVGALGVWYALARKRRGAGAAIAVAGPLWTAICLKMIVPAFSGGHSSVFYSRFTQVGGSPAGVVEKSFTHPGTIASAIFTPQEFVYVFYLGMPLLLFFVWSPSMLAVAVPQLAINALAVNQSARLFEYQYVAGVVPFVFVATVLGMQRFPRQRRPYGAAVALVSVTAFFVLLYPQPGLEPFVYAAKDSPAHLRAIRSAIAEVPAGVPVSTTNRIGGQMSGRRYIFSFPVRDRAEWVVVDQRDPWLAIAGEGDSPVLLQRSVALMRTDRRFHTVSSEDGVLVFRRVSR